MIVLLGLLAVIGTATGIVLDMDWLRINHAGLSRIGWCLASVVTGPFAGAAYLICRYFARRRLITAVWQMVGDASSPTCLRRSRLLALRQHDLISIPIFNACFAALQNDAFPMDRTTCE
ncbi:hypothetical protein [Burkholderia alba]|uniref:hypothetical protein n=1 Tax=Burkholderia alba TaxID=2683677 RepID=UPI002B051C1B|nr:hypothetical protein [Burkholderia alba]